jgi:hypothetical protein
MKKPPRKHLGGFFMSLKIVNSTIEGTKKRPRLARPLSTTKTPKKTILSDTFLASIGPKTIVYEPYFN